MVSLQGYKDVATDPLDFLETIQKEIIDWRYARDVRDVPSIIASWMELTGTVFSDYLLTLFEYTNGLPELVVGDAKERMRLLNELQAAKEQLISEAARINWLKLIRGDSAVCLSYWENDDGTCTEAERRKVHTTALRDRCRADDLVVIGDEANQKLGLAFKERWRDGLDGVKTRQVHALDLGDFINFKRGDMSKASVAHLESVSTLVYKANRLASLLVEANGRLWLEGIEFIGPVKTAAKTTAKTAGIRVADETKAVFPIGLFG